MKKKVALVHDYLAEFGGAERVLLELTELFPEAPIYTSFVKKSSYCYCVFKHKKIIESRYAKLIKFKKLYSPLRFLLPQIWKSIDLSEFDLVITSTSNYIARGFKTSDRTKIVAYCHTPPRFLYGFQTGISKNKNVFVKIYSALVSHYLRFFDFYSAQKINYWISNSENVQARIKKFYKKESQVIYPPIDTKNIINQTKNLKKENYFVIVSRIVGTKGLEQAIKAFNKNGKSLKIVGTGDANYVNFLKNLAKNNIEFLGRVEDSELYKIYAKAHGFLALAKDEDFGMTLVESQASGTPVIAFDGGGFSESVNKKTGILINEISTKEINKAIKILEKIKWNRNDLIKNASEFSKENFDKKIMEYIKNLY